MTDELVNQRIAEACGWKIEPSIFKFGFVFVVKNDERRPLPYYCADLNAMHEAEKMLSKAQWEDFVQHLANDWSSVSDAWKDVCHATARQRAEAFLRTLGKWNQSGDATEMVKEVQK